MVRSTRQSPDDALWQGVAFRAVCNFFVSCVPLLTVCVCGFSTSPLRLAVIRSSRTFARGTLKGVALTVPTNATTSTLACALRFVYPWSTWSLRTSTQIIVTRAAIQNTHCVLTLQHAISLRTRRHASRSFARIVRSLRRKKECRSLTFGQSARHRRAIGQWASSTQLAMRIPLSTNEVFMLHHLL